MKKELSTVGELGTVEYARVDNLVLMNYHVRSRESSDVGPSLDNYLKIVCLDDQRMVYSDIISHGSRSAVPDSFFVRNGVAYYIKDQKTLFAISLSQ